MLTSTSKYNTTVLHASSMSIYKHFPHDEQHVQLLKKSEHNRVSARTFTAIVMMDKYSVKIFR